jgi:hypothetical protein
MVLIISAMSANDEWAIPLFSGGESVDAAGKSKPQLEQTMSVADISALHFGQYAICRSPVDQVSSLRSWQSLDSTVDVLAERME